MKRQLLFLLIFILSVGYTHAQVDFVWGMQFGSDSDERTRDLVIDTSNNVYVFGKTKGIVGKENFGGYDGFIIKVDSLANKIWEVQIGSEKDDDLIYAAVDGKGNIYAAGYISVTSPGSIPNMDILVVKIDNNGKILWQKQYGTDSLDIGMKIAVNSIGDVYVIGSTKGKMGNVSFGQADCVILHLDSEGNKVKVLQFGTSSEEQGYGITIGRDSNIYICGTTEGNLAAQNAGNSDIFWGIFSPDLMQLSMKQLGTEKYNCAYEIKTDSKNNIYIAGSTDWTLKPGQKLSGDCFLQKWNNVGAISWTKEFGTCNWDGINGLTVVNDNKIIVSGCMDNPNCKSFCRMYNAEGSLLWSRNFVAQGGRGTCGKGVCTDRLGYIYHTGYTGANLFSSLRGEHDVFLIKMKTDIRR